MYSIPVKLDIHNTGRNTMPLVCRMWVFLMQVKYCTVNYFSSQHVIKMCP